MNVSAGDTGVDCESQSALLTRFPSGMEFALVTADEVWALGQARTG